MDSGHKTNKQILAAFVVICLAVVGFFTGLQSPMKAPESKSPLEVANDESHLEQLEHPTAPQPGVIPATHYTKMSEVMQALRNESQLSGLKSMGDPLAEIKIDSEEKHQALQRRDQNRAYNGAPPTIPHPIDQLSDASCVACHGVGIKTESLRVSRMSHQFLTNCTQCHVENNPHHQAAVVFRENSFDGVDAPEKGPRAFPGAPPQIPHATWMRSDCMSCHGYAGLHGIRTTHPWRNNCQQCHAPAASTDQTFLVNQSQFLPGPTIKSD